MTVLSPSIVRNEKPARERPCFETVSRGALAAIPGRKGLPFLGILPEAVRDPLSFASRMYERFGPVHRFYACGSWNVQLVGPAANELVLLDLDRNFSAYGGWRPVFGRHFDGGLLLRDGADHQWHRKLLAFAFKREHLQGYLSVFANNAERACRSWSGRTVEAYALCQQLTFANGYTAFLGRPSDQATRRDLSAFRNLMRSAAAALPWALPGTAHHKAERAKRHIEGLLRPLLADRPDPERSDLAAVLVRLKHERLLTDDEVLAHLTFVIAASFDTLSSGTLSTLYHLAVDREWQGRVREELCSAIPSAAQVDLEQLQHCEQSEWAVKEALRLKAAAPVLWRRALRDVEFEGYLLPAGTITGVNPMLTHFLPSVWQEPHRFNPERFAPENARKRHRFAFVPFGAGAHGCLGANYAALQARVFLRRLLEQHELVLAQSNEPRWYHWPNCRPVGGLKLMLRRL
jgi:cytochrome P450